MIDRSPSVSTLRNTHRYRWTVAASAALWLLTACHPKAPTGDAASDPAAAAMSSLTDADDDKSIEKEGVTLTAAQAGKLGITVEPALALEHRDEAMGYGVVINHDVIAQAAADLITAEATERLSRSSLARAQKLRGTPGAVSADVEDTAAQKFEIDAAALTATRQKLSSIFGMNPPWNKSNSGGTLQALASGRFKLLRVIFPLGSLPESEPTTLRAARIGTVKAGAGWRTFGVWAAPADSAVPGRSFFGLLKTQEAREGERLQVFAPVGAATSGVVVPAEAAVLSRGKYWCYVQKGPSVFARVPIDIGTPIAVGYFVKKGVAVGDKIVTTAAGQLLAKETGAAAESD